MFGHGSRGTRGKKRKRNGGSSDTPGASTQNATQTQIALRPLMATTETTIADSDTFTGKALIPALKYPFNKAGTSTTQGFLGSDDEEELESDSDVEIIIRDVKRPKTVAELEVEAAHKATKLKNIIDPYITTAYLDVDGVDLPRIRDGVLEALCHTRQASDQEPSYKPVILKNLIVIFQGMTLFEDCLLKGFRYKQSNGASLDSKRRVLSSLQKAIGYPVNGDRDNKIIYVITKEYKEARIRHIMRLQKMGKDSEQPTTPMEMLLIRLIDRCIVFGHTKEPLRNSRDERTGVKRVAARVETIEDALASCSGPEGKLYTEFATLIPSALRGSAPEWPWKIPEWVSGQHEIQARLGETWYFPEDDKVASEADTGTLPAQKQEPNKSPVKPFGSIEAFFAHMQQPGPTNTRVFDDDWNEDLLEERLARLLDMSKGKELCKGNDELPGSAKEERELQVEVKYEKEGE
ncbi:unnamed protein product [Discula destructiva]